MEGQQSLDLIAHYERQRVLWGTRDAGFCNKQLRGDAWEHIGREMHLPVAALKLKIKSLMGSYRREKSRLKHSLITGAAREEIYRSRWFAFDSFSFLSDRDVPRGRADIINDE